MPRPCTASNVVNLDFHYARTWRIRGFTLPPRSAYQAATLMCGDHGMGVDLPWDMIVAFVPGRRYERTRTLPSALV